MKMKLAQQTATIEYSADDISFLQTKLSGVFNSLAQLKIDSREMETLQCAAVNLNRISEVMAKLNLHIYKDSEPRMDKNDQKTAAIRADG